MPSGSGLISPTPSVSDEEKLNDHREDENCNEPSLTRSISYDPTPYVQRARVTRAAPPKPACNPMQFVQIKPCNLYQTAQEQIKRAEEVKKVKEVKKEDPEDWQSNLDNWKSCRRKRVEHIIDRVVEVKKLELEEHDRTRRKSKTFSEMLEERGSKGRKCSLPVYAEDDANDFSDLGIGTSSTSGKSSLSEDFDNHSVISDNQDAEKQHSDVENNSNQGENTVRDYISSPGYDTSSSNAPTSSPDPCEYTYEGAIQDYKSRVMRASASSFISSTSTTTIGVNDLKSDATKLPRPKAPAADIEYRLNAFESNALNQSERIETVDKKTLPKVDINKRREMFEKESNGGKSFESTGSKAIGELTATISIKDRLSSLQNREEVNVRDAAVKKLNRLSGEFSRVKDRLSNIESPIMNIDAVDEKLTIIDVPVVPLKDRLITLHSAAFQEKPRDPAGAKKIDLLTDQKPNEEKREELNGNEYQYHSETTLIQYNVEYNGSTNYNSVEPGKNGSYLNESLANLLGAQIVENNGDNGLPLEAIQEEREEQQLTSILPKKPEVMPRTTRIITPDSHKIEFQNEARNGDILQSEMITDFNDDDDNEDVSVIEALDIALNAIDIEKSATDQVTTTDQIYEDIDNLNESPAIVLKIVPEIIQKPSIHQRSQVHMPGSNGYPDRTDEPYYQVPKRMESFYEVPSKSCPVPVYENVDMYYDTTVSSEKFAGNGFPQVPFTLESNKQQLEPPKEKPPPPPDDSTDDEQINDNDLNSQDAMKRMNSTKRIKKEIRNKRSSFLGIDGSIDDDSFLELTVAPPPDMAAFIQEERRLEKQMYIKAGLYDSSDTTDSRDSGVSENHSRQSSEPLTTSSEEHDPEAAAYMAKTGHQNNGNRQSQTNGSSSNHDWLYNDNYVSENDPILKHLDERERMKCIADDMHEKEEVLKVERELLQLEQEELKRQRDNSSLRKSFEDLDDETLRGSIQDVNDASNLYANMSNRYDFYQVQTNYRKSMPNLQSMNPYEHDEEAVLRPIPPAKPLRVQEYLRYSHKLSNGVGSVDAVNSHNLSTPMHLNQAHFHSQSTEDFVPLRPPSANTNGYANMTRHTLHALSAVPKPKFQDAWVQQRNDLRHNDYVNSDAFAHQPNGKGRYSESRLPSMQPLKRNSDVNGFNYNNHWLIQEAEQRRIDQQRSTRPVLSTTAIIQRRGSNDNKPLPEAVIETLTQRVQSRLSDKKRFSPQQYTHHGLNNHNAENVVSPQHQHHYHGHQHMQMNMLTIEPPKEILSVSGKKKCSYCNEELGRGAAMIIESLRLFYHLDCFKCCVCRVQLGDGVTGADVRVRNQKLHCNNCFSNDDGIKFSCV